MAMDLLEEKQPDINNIVAMLHSHIMLAVLYKLRPNDVPPTVDSINIQLVISVSGYVAILLTFTSFGHRAGSPRSPISAGRRPEA